MQELKTMTFKIDKDLHAKIKLNATAKGKTITQYILDLIEEDSKNTEYSIKEELRERKNNLQRKRK